MALKLSLKYNNSLLFNSFHSFLLTMRQHSWLLYRYHCHLHFPSLRFDEFCLMGLYVRYHIEGPSYSALVSWAMPLLVTSMLVTCFPGGPPSLNFRRKEWQLGTIAGADINFTYILENLFLFGLTSSTTLLTLEISSICVLRSK